MSTRDKIRRFITDTFLVDDFSDEDSFLAGRIVDSTGVLELVTFLEEEFRFKIPDRELTPENLDSVQNVCAFVERRRAAL